MKKRFERKNNSLSLFSQIKIGFDVILKNKQVLKQGFFPLHFVKFLLMKECFLTTGPFSFFWLFSKSTSILNRWIVEIFDPSLI